jgi:hypothetical protein
MGSDEPDGSVSPGSVRLCAFHLNSGRFDPDWVPAVPLSFSVISVFFNVICAFRLLQHFPSVVFSVLRRTWLQVVVGGGSSYVFHAPLPLLSLVLSVLSGGGGSARRYVVVVGSV